MLARPLLRLGHLDCIFSHFGRRAWEIAVVYELVREGKGEGGWRVIMKISMNMVYKAKRQTAIEQYEACLTTEV